MNKGKRIGLVSARFIDLSLCYVCLPVLTITVCCFLTVKTPFKKNENANRIMTLNTFRINLSVHHLLAYTYKMESVGNRIRK